MSCSITQQLIKTNCHTEWYPWAGLYMSNFYWWGSEFWHHLCDAVLGTRTGIFKINKTRMDANRHRTCMMYHSQVSPICTTQPCICKLHNPYSAKHSELGKLVDPTHILLWISWGGNSFVLTTKTKVKIVQHNRLQTVFLQQNFESKLKTEAIFLRVE